jgi:mono/diheme cytochrome c family protein
MKALPGFFLGIAVTLAVVLLAAYVTVTQGFIPPNADARAPRLERWAANTSLHAVFRKLPAQQNPLPANDQTLIAGIKLYAQNCAYCHGDASGKATATADGMYIRAPQLGAHGVEDDPDQVTYWKIAHGYRWTGMPGFGRTLNQTQMWQLTAFLKTMDRLPPAAEREWRQVRALGAIAPPRPRPPARR